MRPLELGNVRVQKIFEMDSAVPMLEALPGVTAADLAKMKRWHDDPTEFGNEPASSKMVFGVHSWLVQVDGLNVLIDTCDGNHKNRSLEAVNQLNTPYLEGFSKAGVSPEQVDLVLCTHLHFDHVGWNTRLENGRWVPTFPNARYLFSRKDYEHFLHHELEGIHAEAFADSIVPVMEAGRGEIVEANQIVHREIGNGIWLNPAHGHSPGSCTIHAQRGGGEALFWGDVIHHPVQLVRPDLAFFFDMDATAASATRRQLLERVADSEITCFPAHFRGTSAGYVKRDDDVYRYEFVSE